MRHFRLITFIFSSKLFAVWKEMIQNSAKKTHTDTLSKIVLVWLSWITEFDQNSLLKTQSNMNNMHT